MLQRMSRPGGNTWPLALVLLCAVVSSASLLSGCKKSEEHLRKGHVFFNLGNLDKARHHYSQAAKENPDNAAALTGLGDVATEEKDFKKAQQHYENARKADPSFIEAYHKLAVAFAATKNFLQAKRVLEAALKRDTRNAFAWHALGNVTRKIGDHSESLEHYRKALTADPNYAPALYSFGNASVDLGRTSDAKKTFEILDEKGERALANHGQARLAASEGDFASAAEYLQRILNENLTHPESLLNDQVFKNGWSHSEMKPLRAKIEELVRKKTKTRS